MDFNPFPQLEAALYRRNDEQPSSPLECHNHILQGSYLRYPPMIYFRELSFLERLILNLLARRYFLTIKSSLHFPQIIE